MAVLLDLSGDRRPSGNAQRDAIELWLDQRQARAIPSATGVAPPLKVRTRTVDVAGSDAKLLIELRRAVVEQASDAIVVGTPVTPQLAAFVPAVELAKVPVLLTLPASEAIASRWIFALAPSVERLARIAIDDVIARRLGQENVQLVPETAAAQTESVALSNEAARRRLSPMTVVRTERPDQSAAPSRLGSTDAFHVLGAPRDNAALSRGGGIPPPFYLSYLTDPADLGAFRDISTVQWPGSRRVVGTATVGRTAASAQFVQAFGDRHGPPSTHAATAYDAIALLELAADEGPTGTTIDPERLRTGLERTTFAGIATTYAFSPSDHAGSAADDLAYLRWNGSAVVPLSQVRRQ